MKFSIQFKIGNRWGSKSTYSLRGICLHIANVYSLTEAELERVVTLQRKESFENNELLIQRK